MKILLINPIYNRLSEDMDRRKCYFSIALSVLQTEFTKCGATCDILDLNYCKDAVRKCGSYEMIVDKYINLKEYRYIGITSFCNSFVNAILLAEEIKRQSPDTIVYLGGAHVSACASDTVKAFPFIDFVNIGEGEKSAKYILEYFCGVISKEKIPNIVYYDSFQVKHTHTLELLTREELPMIRPQLELLGVNKKRIFNGSVHIEGGRGCPYSCIFCSTKNFWQRRCRMKPLDIILIEMDQLYKACGVHHFSVTHDLFTANADFIEKFCDAMKNRKYTWTCSARFDTIDCSMLKKMYESGCQDVFFGIETGSQKLQKTINKNLDLDRVEEIIAYCNKHHYTHTISFILGFPFETIGQLDETLRLIYKHYASPYTKIRMGILTPEIGTKIFMDYHDRLKYDNSFLLDNTDYIPIEKEKEITLIQLYPDIFSHFYYVENPYLSIHSIRFIEKSLRFLCINYYKTFGLAILKHGSIIKIISDISRISFDTMNEYEYKEHISCFEEAFKEYITDDSDLSGIYKYEQLLKEIKSKAAKEGEFTKIISLNKPYPAICACDILDCKTGAYTYSIHAKRDSLNARKVTLKISQLEVSASDVE